jgi:hypothetical protein
MENYTKVATLENEFEAQIVKSILEEREIPHYVKSFYDVAYDGLYQKSQGWGAVFAPIEYRNEIVEIVGDVRK